MFGFLAILVTLQAAAPAAAAAPAVEEIVVTARRDKCFTQYAAHPVSDQQLQALGRSWAAGTPVRVIEPRGASLKCEFQIMQTLARHGAHMAQFVSRAEDVAEDRSAAVTGLSKELPTPVATPPSSAYTNIIEPAAAGPGVVPHAIVPARRVPAARASRSGIVTLVCAMHDPENPYRLDVEIDEGRGTVTPSRPDTGGGSEMRAAFMASSVRFGPFTLDRTTLHIQRMVEDYSGETGRAPRIVQGQCGITKANRIL